MEKLTRIMMFPKGAIWVIRSSEPRKLFKKYLSQLKLQKHPNKELQEIYNEQGVPTLEAEPEH